MVAETLTALAGCIAVIVPGLLFSLALFPERGSMDLQTRLASGAGLGLLLAVWMSYILARYHRLVLEQFLGVMAAAGAALFVLAYLRGGIKLPRLTKKPEQPAVAGGEGGAEVQAQAGDSGKS